MTTAQAITYVPRSNDELKNLTNRLRSELKDHYDFAPKANARLEEVVLGTLGMPNGRQQWQSLVSGKPGSGYRMPLYINLTEVSETDTDIDDHHLVIPLDARSVHRIASMAEMAKQADVSIKLHDIEALDPTGEVMEEVTVSIGANGDFDVTFTKRVRNMWPITVTNSGALRVDQILAAYQEGETKKGTLGAFSPAYSGVIYLLEDFLDADGDLTEEIHEAIDCYDDDESVGFFDLISPAVVIEGEVKKNKSQVDREVASDRTKLIDAFDTMDHWIRQQTFYKSLLVIEKSHVLRAIYDLKKAIEKDDVKEMKRKAAEVMEVVPELKESMPEPWAMLLNEIHLAG